MNSYHQLSKVLILCFALIFGQRLSAQTKVACVGNSITFGYGLSSASTQSYPSRLQALLGSDFAVSNYGVSARTLLKKGDRPYWVEPQYKAALALNPDVVIIMLGTNDAKLNTNWAPHKNEFVGDYKALVQSFRNLESKPQIWICKIVPAYKEIWEITDAVIHDEVNPKIVEVTHSVGTGLIDMYNAMENQGSLFQSDGIHPNTTGAQKMAEYIHSFIISDTLSISQKGDTLSAPDAFAFQWYKDFSKIEAPLGTQQQIEVSETGDYSVTLQLKNTDEKFPLKPVFIEVEEKQDTIPADSVIINSFPSGSLLRIYPNPGDSFINIETEMKSGLDCKIYTLDGGLVISQKLDANQKMIDTSALTKGIYSMTIITHAGQNLSEKLMIR